MTIFSRTNQCGTFYLQIKKRIEKKIYSIYRIWSEKIGKKIQFDTKLKILFLCISAKKRKKTDKILIKEKRPKLTSIV